MTEVLFYHLERSAIDQVLPSLLEKCLTRQWRCLVQVGSLDAVEKINRMLWIYRDDSFLPHGTARTGFEAQQPIFITADIVNPNDSTVCFLLDGASLGDIAHFSRVIFIFQGHDQMAVQQARVNWKSVKELGYEATYWQQNSQAKWEQKG